MFSPQNNPQQYQQSNNNQQNQFQNNQGQFQQNTQQQVRAQFQGQGQGQNSQHQGQGQQHQNFGAQFQQPQQNNTALFSQTNQGHQGTQFHAQSAPVHFQSQTTSTYFVQSAPSHLHSGSSGATSNTSNFSQNSQRAHLHQQSGSQFQTQGNSVQQAFHANGGQQAAQHHPFGPFLPLNQPPPFASVSTSSNQNQPTYSPQIAQVIQTPTQMDRHEIMRPESNSWEVDFSEIKVEKELGRGAFGIVYKATWRLQDVAVKVLLAQNMGEKELSEFRREAGLMASLRPHKNVVQLLGICSDPTKKLAIVTDFFSRGSLESYLFSQAQISWRNIAEIAKGVSAGIYHLHQEKIIHRDLASRNILLKGNLEPAVADFGLSKKAHGGFFGSYDKDNKFEDKEFKGPYKWLPPEALQKGEFSTKTDSWSFGVVLWEMVSRSPPFNDLTIYQAADAVINRDVRLDIPQICPPSFARLMKCCWQRDPNNRPNFETLNHELSKIVNEFPA